MPVTLMSPVLMVTAFICTNASGPVTLMGPVIARLPWAPWALMFTKALPPVPLMPLLELFGPHSPQEVPSWTVPATALRVMLPLTLTVYAAAAELPAAESWSLAPYGMPKPGMALLKLLSALPFTVMLPFTVRLALRL